MTLSKRQKEVQKLIDNTKRYTLKQAISQLKKAPCAKFDESVTLSFRLNIDQKEAPQSVRGTVPLPHGTGKPVRVAVFCKGEDVNEAKKAGADYVGSGELLDKVSSGWTDFDVAISTPEMMKDLGKVGKILGPRGLMPNPKAGTVTQEVAKAVKEVKAGKIEFKMDKQSNIHVPLGKISFSEDFLLENATTLIEAVLKARPANVKGQFVKSIALAKTMGPGIKLDMKDFKQ